MDIEDKYWKSDIAKDGKMDKVEFVVCSEDEDTDTASSEDDYSDTDSDFENHRLYMYYIAFMMSNICE